MAPTTTTPPKAQRHDDAASSGHGSQVPSPEPLGPLQGEEVLLWNSPAGGATLPSPFEFGPAQPLHQQHYQPPTTHSIPITGRSQQLLKASDGVEFLSPALLGMSISPMLKFSKLGGPGSSIGLNNMSLDMKTPSSFDLRLFGMSTMSPPKPVGGAAAALRPQSPLYDPTVPWAVDDTAAGAFVGFAGTAEELILEDDFGLGGMAAHGLNGPATGAPARPHAAPAGAVPGPVPVADASTAFPSSSGADTMWTATMSTTPTLLTAGPPMPHHGEPPHQHSPTPSTFFQPTDQLFAEAGVDAAPILMPGSAVGSQLPSALLAQAGATVGGGGGGGVRRAGPGASASIAAQCGPGASSRDVHNAMERERRVVLRRCFDQLREVIPTLADHKAPSLQILNQAATYIRELQAEDERLTRDKEELRRQNELLSQRIHASGTAAAAPVWAS